MKSKPWKAFFVILMVFLLGMAVMVSCDDDDDEEAGNTWTDEATGLTWATSPAEKLMNWQAAMDHCDGLDYAGETDWRLPDIDELRTIIRGCPETETGGACGMVDACLDCWTNICEACEEMYEGIMDNCRFPSSLSGGCEDPYWSASVNETDAGEAGAADFFSATLFCPGKSFQYQVRCVRGDVPGF